MGSNCNYDLKSREVAGATASPAAEHAPCPFQREAGWNADGDDESL